MNSSTLPHLRQHGTPRVSTHHRHASLSLLPPAAALSRPPAIALTFKLQGRGRAGEGLISRRPQHSLRGGRAHSYAEPGSFSLTASHGPHRESRPAALHSTEASASLRSTPPSPHGAKPRGPLTFWMAAGVISPFPRCRGAANATDMSHRCRQQGPTRARPLTRTPRWREAAAIREQSCAGGGAAAQRDGPSCSRRGRIKLNRELLLAFQQRERNHKGSRALLGA